MANCPACKNTLQEVTINRVVVDFCANGCSGIWFDVNELRKFDDHDEFVPHQVLRATTAEKTVIDRDAHRECPQCAPKHLVRRAYDSRDFVEIDECLECGGIFLDGGELAYIRDENERSLERERIFQGFLAQVGESKHLGPNRLRAIVSFLFARDRGN
jgi:uncharacterized protein